MKYYLYLSPTKIEMLFPQIPLKERENLAVELKIDLKIFSMTVKDENKIDDTIFSKCDLLCKYLEKTEKMGSIDFPNSYFEGELPMRYGIYKDYASDLTFFTGETDETYVILIGSSENIIHSAKNFKPREDYSPDYYTMKFLNSTIENPTVDNEMYSDERILKELYKSSKNMIGIKQNVNFFAKRLFYGQIEGSKKVILGTPFFVELIE